MNILLYVPVKGTIAISMFICRGSMGEFDLKTVRIPRRLNPAFTAPPIKFHINIVKRCTLIEFLSTGTGTKLRRGE